MPQRIAPRPAEAGQGKLSGQPLDARVHSHGLIWHMIEIGLGILAIMAAAGITLGLSDGLVPFPLGSGVIVTLAISALALMLRGWYRLSLKRGKHSRHRVRSTGLAFAVAGLAIVIALTLPALSETANLISVGGFPIGTYILGQGIFILFAILLFLFAGWQRRIDAAGDP